MRRIAVVDAPSNLGLRPPTASSVPGCAKAPGALRDHNLLARLGARDAGCITPPRYDPAGWQPGDGVAQSAEIAVFVKRLADRIGSVLGSGDFPLVLGGDCSILLGAGLAMRRFQHEAGGRIGLVYVDGHSDFRHEGNASYVGAAAGEALALATGRGQANLASIEQRRPYFRDVDVALLGIRTHDEYRLDLQAAGIVARAVPELRSDGAARSAQWARDQLRDCAGFWVHIDVDVLDPAVMPAVDAPDVGGIAYRELEILISGLVSDQRCLGAQVTVFDPDYDPDGQYAAEVADVLVAGLEPLITSSALVAASPDPVISAPPFAAPISAPPISAPPLFTPMARPIPPTVAPPRPAPEPVTPPQPDTPPAPEPATPSPPQSVTPIEPPPQPTTLSRPAPESVTPSWSAPECVAPLEPVAPYEPAPEPVTPAEPTLRAVPPPAAPTPTAAPVAAPAPVSAPSSPAPGARWSGSSASSAEGDDSVAPSAAWGESSSSAPGSAPLSAAPGLPTSGAELDESPAGGVEDDGWSASGAELDESPAGGVEDDGWSAGRAEQDGSPAGRVEQDEWSAGRVEQDGSPAGRAEQDEWSAGRAEHDESSVGGVERGGWPAGGGERGDSLPGGGEQGAAGSSGGREESAASVGLRGGPGTGESAGAGQPGDTDISELSGIWIADQPAPMEANDDEADEAEELGVDEFAVLDGRGGADFGVVGSLDDVEPARDGPAPRAEKPAWFLRGYSRNSALSLDGLPRDSVGPGGLGPRNGAFVPSQAARRDGAELPESPLTDVVPAARTPVEEDETAG
ncbi:hypothetical protein GCM10018962_94230 [Dactylosporangium matsuzakiense]|uniref:Arginase n=1 Tax=Dactylosporangium matsuzakiense TaxID=53360 RepID=A0A9W6NR95_9ACTN|nr:arginase family protein [Dactylosporangium matsuzakiense]GLL06193.1 hypothetical protein GCM10017581_079410 [Dactylosporangium matsuzakiense]